MTAPTTTRTNVLAVGDLIEKQVGRTQIRLMRVAAEAWTVEVYEGSRRVADQCVSFTDEVEAALTASAYFQLAVAETAPPKLDPARALDRGEIRIHRAGPTEIRIFQTPAGGCLVQVRRDGVTDRALCRHEAHEIRALNYYASLVMQTAVTA